MKTTGGTYHPSDSGKSDSCTMRDHFAGLAMQSMMEHVVKVNGFAGFDMVSVAKAAYAMADEMLKERTVV